MLQRAPRHFKHGHYDVKAIIQDAYNEALTVFDADETVNYSHCTLHFENKLMESLLSFTIEDMYGVVRVAKIRSCHIPSRFHGYQALFFRYIILIILKSHLFDTEEILQGIKETHVH